MLKYQSSKIAASAIFVAHKIILGKQFVWPNELIDATSYSEIRLRSCANDMIILLNGIERCTL